ncbi:hypothetical protein NE857_24770 [Nocardiopsis exhalans]|uniref:DUF779 domain-containing protein n=1 Tax=Nocardiopsis exhalans TaxID=163604 RepID=A0ABY5D5M9_9ACTN|nr:hypothetical protein [Nocardiopsis exhalans]USY18492.1 hypothetical protein NE857_24770 [Nocardiopsis exhalans]
MSESERLPADVTDALEMILEPGDPVHAALREQVPHLRLHSRCTCGCGTAYFEIDTETVEPAPINPGSPVVAAAPLVTEDGECPGEVLVFSYGGYLTSLEVCSWGEDIEPTLADARRWLRSYD